MEISIETMCPEDWEAVRAIYEEGMATRRATFETSAPTWDEWNAVHLLTCRLVARKDGQVIGWAALSPVSRRPCYAGVAETSIYIAGEARGQGVGKALYQALIQQSEQAGIWMLQTSIFAENTPSLALHEAVGFRVVGRRERIAQRDGAWHDTILLERRSRVAGI